MKQTDRKTFYKMFGFFQIFLIFVGVRLTSAKECKTHNIVYDSHNWVYCSGDCCNILYDDPCCYYKTTYTTSGTKLSNGAYYGMTGGGILFIVLVVACCCYGCRSRRPSGGQVISTFQPTMPYAPYSISPGAHPFGMTNNSFSGGHNPPIASAPVTNGKRSSSLSSLSSSLKLASNAFEMAGNLGEIGGSVSEISEAIM